MESQWLKTIPSPLRRRQQQPQAIELSALEALPHEGEDEQAMVGRAQGRSAEAKALRQNLKGDIMAKMAYMENMLSSLQSLSSDDEAATETDAVESSIVLGPSLKRDSIAARSDVSAQSTVDSSAAVDSLREELLQSAACAHYGPKAIGEDGDGLSFRGGGGPLRPQNHQQAPQEERLAVGGKFPPPEKNRRGNFGVERVTSKVPAPSPKPHLYRNSPGFEPRLRRSSWRGQKENTDPQWTFPPEVAAVLDARRAPRHQVPHSARYSFCCW